MNFLGTIKKWAKTNLFSGRITTETNYERYLKTYRFTRNCSRTHQYAFRDGKYLGKLGSKNPLLFSNVSGNYYSDIRRFYFQHDRDNELLLNREDYQVRSLPFYSVNCKECELSRKDFIEEQEFQQIVKKWRFSHRSYDQKLRKSIIYECVSCIEFGEYWLSPQFDAVFDNGNFSTIKNKKNQGGFQYTFLNKNQTVQLELFE